MYLDGMEPRPVSAEEALEIAQRLHPVGLEDEQAIIDLSLHEQKEYTTIEMVANTAGLRALAAAYLRMAATLETDDSTDKLFFDDWIWGVDWRNAHLDFHSVSRVSSEEQVANNSKPAWRDRLNDWLGYAVIALIGGAMVIGLVQIIKWLWSTISAWF